MGEYSAGVLGKRKKGRVSLGLSSLLLMAVLVVLEAPTAVLASFQALLFKIMKKDVIDYTLTDRINMNKCACRVRCFVKPTCTAVSVVDAIDDKGRYLLCHFSVASVLTIEDFENDTQRTGYSIIQQGILKNKSQTISPTESTTIAVAVNVDQTINATPTNVGCIDHYYSNKTFCNAIGCSSDHTCNKPYDHQKEACVFCCKRPAVYFYDLGCITPIYHMGDRETQEDKCKEMGMRLVEGLQKDHLECLSEVFKSGMDNRYYEPWIGAKKRKWITDKTSIPEDMFLPEFSSSFFQESIFLRLSQDPFGLVERHCGEDRTALCQLLMENN